MTQNLTTFRPTAWNVSEDERLRIACRAASIGVWQWDILTNEMRYSDIARKICGFPEIGPIDFEMVRSVTHPDDYPRTSAMAKRALDPELREVVEYRYRVVRADTGEVRWVKAYGEAQFAVIEGTERAVQYIGSIQDVTKEKQREDALGKSEARMRLAIDAGQLALWEVDLDTDTVTGSTELNRLYGFPEESSPSLDDLRSRYAPGEKERVTEEVESLLARGETRFRTEIRHIWPDGTEKWLLVSAQFGSNEDGRGGMNVLGVVADITELKRQEERLSTLARELRHRLLNTVALIGALASRSWPADYVDAKKDFQARLAAIGKSTELMFGNMFVGEVPTVRRILLEITDPYRLADVNSFKFAGPEVRSAEHTRALAMAFHELCTNAVKYGALSLHTGRVSVTWCMSLDGSLRIEWREHGGPPVNAPKREGFGTLLLTKLLFAPPHKVSLDFLPDGLRCTILILGWDVVLKSE